jgi:putative ABC transport system permease protein
LTLLSIALGTAVMVAVDLANMTARQSFRQSVTVLSGPMTHEIIAREGDIPEEFYTRLRIDWKLRASSPQLIAPVNVAGLPYTLVGLDSFAMLFQPQAGLNIPADTLPRLLTEPNSALISSDLAARENIKVGDRLLVTLKQAQRTLTILAILDIKQDARLAELIVTDIATAQSLLDKPGVLSRIQLQLNDSQVAQLH